MAEKKEKTMEEEYFGTPLSSAMAMPFNLAVGDIILGRISKIDDEYVYVSTGFKSEGRIPVKEFRPDENGDIGYKLDDEVEVMVDRIADEDIYLSYENVMERRRWEELIRCQEEEEPIEAEVTQQVKGGYRMDVGLPRHAFLPGSHLGIQLKDQADVVGQKLRVLIIEINPDTENIVVSHRDLKKREVAEKEEEVFSNLEVGSVIKGRVTRLVKFGAFVDIGDVEGLVHVSEIAWSRVGHPSSVLKCGEDVEVRVLDVDKDSKKISLSIKQAGEDPWSSIEETIKEDEVITGKVSKVVKFGAFVRLNEDFEGLLHISEIQAQAGGDRKKLSAGDEIKVKVLNVDKKNKRIKLGLAQALSDMVSNEMKQYIDDGSGSSSSAVTLGDMVDGVLDDEEE